MRRPSSHFGLLLVDKPVGPSSHELVQWVRWALKERSVGHCGTLDPQASGLMILLVGKATRLASHFSAEDKSYDAVFALGQSTDTDDAAGRVQESVDLAGRAQALRVAGTAILDGHAPGPESCGEGLEWAPDLTPDLGPGLGSDLSLDRSLDEAPGELASGPWIGTHHLRPPGYSALRINGQRAHELARRGEAPQLAARSMTVFASRSLAPKDWPQRLEAAGSPEVSLRLGARLRVSKGSYIRSLARELGRRLGVPAHLWALHRVGSGRACIDDAKLLSGLSAQAWGARPDGAPKWRIRAGLAENGQSRGQIQGEIRGEGEGETTAEGIDHSREGQARAIRQALQSPWPYLSRPVVEVQGDGLRRAMHRFRQGQRLASDHEDLRALPSEASLTMVDFSAECAVLVRRERPGAAMSRWLPELVLEYATSKPKPS